MRATIPPSLLAHASWATPRIGPMIRMALENLLEWHSRMATALSEEGEHIQSLGWGRDAGKIQACFNILETLGVCDDDFTASNL